MWHITPGGAQCKFWLLTAKGRRNATRLCLKGKRYLSFFYNFKKMISGCFVKNAFVLGVVGGLLNKDGLWFLEVVFLNLI